MARQVREWLGIVLIGCIGVPVSAQPPQSLPLASTPKAQNQSTAVQTPKQGQPVSAIVTFRRKANANPVVETQRIDPNAPTPQPEHIERAPDSHNDPDKQS